MSQLFGTKENRLDKYKRFITDCSSSPNSASNYIDFSRVNGLIRSYYPDFTDIADYDDPDYLQHIYDEMSSYESFKEFKDNNANRGKNNYCIH